jgi:hypothetical protein
MNRKTWVVILTSRDIAVIREATGMLSRNNEQSDLSPDHLAREREKIEDVLDALDSAKEEEPWYSDK